MTAIADIGAILELTPQDEIWIATKAGQITYVRDFSPFRMSVKGLLQEQDTLYGVYGPVVGGAPRYHHLIASVLVRLDGSDLRRDRSTQVNFKVGSTRVRRVSGFDIRDPRGTEIDGFPRIGRFAHVEVVNTDAGAAPDDIPATAGGDSAAHKGPPSVN